MSKKVITKANAIFYEVAHKKSYREAVLALRNKYDIPEKGFRREDEREQWEDWDLRNIVEFTDDQVDLNRIHGLSPMFYSHLENYLFFNKLESDEDVEGVMCTAKISNDAGVDRLHIIVNKYASIEDVRNYLSESKKEINELLNSIRGDYKKTYRTKENKDRDDFIYDLYKKKISKGNYEYRESAIAEKVHENYGGKIMTAEQVSAVIAREKKYRE